MILIVTVSELRKKEVIRLCDGKSLGVVTDVSFDGCRGQLCTLCVLCCGGLLPVGGETLSVPWGKVSCIGDDAVLVSLTPEECAGLQTGTGKGKRKKRGYKL